MRNKLLVAGTLALAMTCTTVFSSITPAVVKAASVSTAQTQTAENSDDYVYCYAGLTWAEYWKAEGVMAAGDTTSSDTADSHDEKDKGAFDAVTRATTNHGLHRGSYQCTAVIKTAEGEYSVSHWSSDGKTVYFTDGTSAGWNRGTLTLTDGTTQTMTEYDVLGLKYVPVKVKSSDYASFKEKYSVVENNGTLIGGYGEKNLQDYNVTASVDKDTNGLKTAEKQSDGSFTFTQRSNGSSSGIKDKTLKTADLNNMGATVKDASGSYGEFLRVDFTKNYGDLGANMQAVKWTYYGNDSTRSKALATYGTKFAADNWMHKSMGIQLGLTNSIRCQLPKGYDGTGYWSLTIYALGYADSTYNFEATDANIVKPDTNAGDTTELNKLVSSVEGLNPSDYEAATMGIAKSDNTAEFAKLVNKTINKITYVTPEGNYVYTFADGIFIKPAYSEEISGTFSDDMKSFTLNQLPTVKNGTLTVTYTVGAGHMKTPYTLYSGAIAKSVSLDLNAIPSDAEGGTYSVAISCDNYADIHVAIPVTEAQKAQLQELIKQAETALKGAGADDSVLLAHKNEAAELLANESSTSADAADLINELTELLKPYQSTEAPTPSIPDSTTASKPNTTTAAKPATKPATTAKKPNTTATKVKLAKQTTKVKANGKKKIKVSWKKDKKASGYEITYSTKKSFKGKKTIVVKSNKTTSKVVKKLTSKKKYFVKVRSYKQVGKTKTYGAYSKVKTVKVK